ncbi:MAG: type II secretion system protein GspD, partial [Myxococcales bacterium]
MPMMKRLLSSLVIGAVLIAAFGQTAGAQEDKAGSLTLPAAPSPADAKDKKNGAKKKKPAASNGAKGKPKSPEPSSPGKFGPSKIGLPPSMRTPASGDAESPLRRGAVKPPPEAATNPDEQPKAEGEKPADAGAPDANPQAPQAGPGETPLPPAPPPPPAKAGPPQMGNVEEDRKDYQEFKRGEKYYIDFYDQELLEFVKQMSEKFKVNFILSDKVKGGKITIISPNPVTREEAWQAFLSALQSKELALVRVGQFYKIISIRDAQRSPIKTYMEGGTTDPSDEVITYLLKLKYLSIQDVDKILKDLKSKDGEIISFEPTNTLLITDAAINIRRMVKIVNELDLPGGRDAIHVIDIYYANASDVAEKLNQIFGDKSGQKQTAKVKTPPRKGAPQDKGGTEGESVQVTLTNVIADERTNQLIIVAPREAMPRILDMITRLDMPIPGDGQVHVYYLENANSEELAQTLTGFTAGSGQAAQKGGKGGKPGSAVLFEGEVKVTADKSTNSLVVVASAKDFGALKKVIRQLDIRRRQVFVEAVIMEVTLSKNNTMGFSMAGGYSFDIGGETVPVYGATTLGSMSAVALDPTTLSGMAVGLRGPDLKGTEGVLGEGISFPSFGVLLQMVQTDSDANVLSTPHILTMDNEEAEIIVGSNVPFITGQARDSNNRPVLSIQRQDVALTMKIKPQINESDFIRLQVQQEITELVSISETLGPTTTKRAAKSVVVVKDNQTIVIGGLLRDRQTNDADKVPLLGDLPILGRLFRRDKDVKEKTNLLIFLTPHIIKDEEDFKRIFKRKMDERNEFLRRFYGTDENYEFEVDYTQKTGVVEAIRGAYEQNEKDLKQKELESAEIIIGPEGKNRAVEIGVTDVPPGGSGGGPAEGDEAKSGFSMDKFPSPEELRQRIQEI